MSILSNFKLNKLLWVCSVVISLSYVGLATPLLAGLFSDKANVEAISESSHGVTLIRPLTKNLAVHRGLNQSNP